MVAINTIHCIIKAFLRGAVSWGTVSSSAAHSAVAEAPPRHSLFHRKSRLPGCLPPSWETPVSLQAIGPWALVLRLRHVGTLSAFQLVRLPPFAGWPGGRLGRGSWQEELASC